MDPHNFSAVSLSMDRSQCDEICSLVYKLDFPLRVNVNISVMSVMYGMWYSKQIF